MLTTHNMQFAATKSEDDMADAILQLKITLKHIRPPVWRRIQVSNQLTLDKLHRILQMVMGWTGSHLHQFASGGMMYSLPEFELEMCENSKKVKLHEVLRNERAKLIYEYDFGDGWEHEILVEKILPPEKGKGYPICLTGKRACPPEDCGGPWGYEELLKIIRNPDHDEYEERIEWLDEDFDPEAFDIDEVNLMLKSAR